MAGNNHREDLSTLAYRAIRAAILDGRWRAGEHLSIGLICESFALSRTPVWAALKKLESEGLVETVPRRGVYVLNFSVEKIAEMYSVREVLEGLVARLVAAKATRRQITMLRNVVEKLERSAVEDDYEEFHRSDIKFHNEMLRLADSVTLARYLTNIYDQMQILRTRSYILPKHMTKRQSEHRDILNCIENGNCALAEETTRLHVRNTLQDALLVYRDS